MSYSGGLFYNTILSNHFENIVVIGGSMNILLHQYITKNRRPNKILNYFLGIEGYL